MKELEIKDIELADGKLITLTIYAQKEDTLFEQDDAVDYGESPYQLVEGKSYQYDLSDKDYQLYESSTVSNNPSKHFAAGTINTRIYVGTLKVDIIRRADDVRVGEVRLEVRSVKAGYRDDYRQMLSDITDQCTELLMQHSSPSIQRFTINPDSDPKSDYQRFAFVRSIIESDLFEEAIHYIQQNPVKRWALNEEEKRIENTKRLGNKEIRQITRARQRIDVPHGSRLRNIIDTLPRSVVVTSKEETLDVPENRFIKYVLQSFLAFCSSIMNNDKVKDDSRLMREARLACNKLNYFLSFPIFRNLSQLWMLPLNSPILQKKEGYREVLQKWLMFDMAACLTWDGGEDVYEAGKKNVAVLYEYWLFFKLMDVFEKKFGIKGSDKKDLISIDNDKLTLSLKQGKTTMLKGKFVTPSRTLQIRFFYNKPFGYSSEYEKSGSWTQGMRPDYTLSIWPDGINMMEAEAVELITHVHFDAKYRIENLKLTDKNDSCDEDVLQSKLSDIKDEEELGTYKRADLLKMHAYKDAIKRTSGAYILYPGTEDEIIEGFQEIIPGLGAFAISPRNYDSSLKGFNKFLDDVIDNFLDRTSQRERLAYHTYNVLQEPSHNLKLDIPEAIKENRGFMPSEINVIVGYCKADNKVWLVENGYYNMPANDKKGSQPITERFVTAKYLLLWNDEGASLHKIRKNGAEIITERRFNEMGYTSSKLRELLKKGFSRDNAIKNIQYDDIYYVFKIEDAEKEFSIYQWDIKNFSKKPHVLKLSELLMKVIE